MVKIPDFRRETVNECCKDISTRQTILPITCILSIYKYKAIHLFFFISIMTISILRLKLLKKLSIF